MDSNSGSLQSSSGDEEYDSRAADSSPLFSAFMNNSSSTHLGAMPNPLRPPSHGQLHLNNNQMTSSIFDPSSLSGYNNFDPLSSQRSLPNQNHPLLNLDRLIWSKNLRSDPNCTDPPNILPSSSPSPPIQTRFRISSASSSPPVVPMPESVGVVTVRPSSLASPQQKSTCSGGTAGTVRNSKKRSRASRRAPTTVLTTDTTNFRAMVQEFTGIPAPPFSTSSSSSPFPRTRFDLFSSSSTIHPSIPSSLSQPPPPPYLLRPFAQKIQPQPPPLPFVSSSSSTNTNNNNTSTISTNMTTTTTTSTNSTSINYQLPVVNSGLIHQVNTTMHNNNNNNPMLSFQSLLQTTPKYQLPNSTNDDFGMGNHGGHVNPHLTASRRGDITSISCGNNNNSNSWGGDGVEVVSDHQGFLFRSVNGNNYGNPQQHQHQRDTTNGGKGNNYMAASPSSNFNGDRGGGGGGGSENVSTTRGEGMVESWLCSSD